MELATTFGILGITVNVAWPLLRHRKHLLFGQIVGATLMATHFMLLDAHTGALVMLSVAVLSALAIPLGKYRRFKYVYLLSVTLVPFICWYTWHGTPSIFSSLALLLFCISNLQVKTKYMRLCLILCIFGWIGHNILISSTPALVSNLFTLSTSIYGLIREFTAAKTRNLPF